MFIHYCADVLKEHGQLFLSTLNRTPKSYALAIVGAENLLNIVPEGTHDWKKFITPEELERMVSVAESKMQVVEKKGLIPSPSLCASGRWSWRLSDSDLDVNYILRAIKL